MAELIISQGDRRGHLHGLRFHGPCPNKTPALEATIERMTLYLPWRMLDSPQRKGTMTFLRSARQLRLVLVATAAAELPVGAAELNDYPTAARADYVFACMKTNGDTRPALEKCSCAIDVIASILPYDRYVAAETFLSLSQVPGRFGAMFQSPEQARAAINELRRAQAEGEVRC